MRRPNLGREGVLRQRRLDARDEIAAIGFVVGMLQPASAAFGEVTARRLLVMRSRGDRAVVEQSVARNAEWHMAAAWRHAVAARSNADDRLVHNRSSAPGIASARSSAIMCGPATS